MSERQLPIIVVLGATQTLAWASGYYLPAVLADPIARDLGVSTTEFFAAFSAALVISALLGPRVGRQIDAIGGRGILTLSNLVFAVGLVLLGLARSSAFLWAAWFCLGAGMGLGLYDAAFATLGRLYGNAARGAITGIALIAGFASTVGWPLTAWGVSGVGWRNTCFVWALAHLLLGLPLNRFLLPKPTGLLTATASRDKPHVPIDRLMLLVSFAFASAWVVTAAMAAHLPRILEAAGASTMQAITAGALIGPAQVAARLLEAGVLRRFHPLLSAKLAALAHPLGAAVLAHFGGASAAGAFAIFHGAGNGILTIARGTVPLAVFGPENYGYRLGLLGAPARMAQAGAPLIFDLIIKSYGAGALAVSSGLSIAALAALCLVRPARVVQARRGDAP